MERADLGVRQPEFFICSGLIAGRGGHVWSLWWSCVGMNNEFSLTIDTPVHRNDFFGRIILRFICLRLGWKAVDGRQRIV